MLRGQFLALNANIREEEKLQDNNLSFQLKNLKKKKDVIKETEL